VFSTVAPWIAHSKAAPKTPATPIMWNVKCPVVEAWKKE
jgi:hypothetical protein